MSSLIPFDPFRGLDSFFNNDDVFSLARTSMSQPAMDVYETDKEVVAEMTLPGMKSEDVDIVFEDGYLKVRGEHKEEKKEGSKKKGYWRREIRQGSFERMAHIPVPVKEDEVKAEFEKGVLKVTLPKAHESSESKKIKVEDKD